MKLVKLILTLGLFLSSLGMALPEPYSTGHATTTVMRILLARHQKYVQLTGLSSQIYLMPYLGGQPTTLGRGAHIEIATGDGALKVNNQLIRSPALIVGRSSADQFNFQAGVFPGALEVRRVGDEISVINLIPIEDYLPRAVAGEMQSSWDLEALKAQAVAARSYALYMHAHPKSDFFDLERDIHDQVYSGAQEVPVRVWQAVNATRGEVLVDGQQPLKAYFHSRCGGRTTGAMQVWNTGNRNASAHTEVQCPYCRNHPYYWKAVMTINELLKNLHLPDLGQNQVKLIPRVYSPVGRVESLIVSNGQKQETFSGNEFRDRLGYSKLKSTLFHWKIENGVIEFDGVGSGHGVGMCQWGAKELAHQGKNYRQILAYFYPSIALKRI